MPYPNTALSAGQLAIIAVVAVVALAAWISAVFLAAREPASRSVAAAGTPENPGSPPSPIIEPGPAAGTEPTAAVKSGPTSVGDRKAA